MDRVELMKTRSDVARNRESLIAAARQVFAREGLDAPLADVADAAGVSRTTLHRHFADRESLNAAVLEQNVAWIEQRVDALIDQPDGLIILFHETLDLQLAAPAVVRALSRRDSAAFLALATTTAQAFARLVPTARANGLLHDGIGERELLIALPMAATAVIEDELAGRVPEPDVVRAMLHRGLFTTPPPTGR